ncbi:hypothetical protein [Amorphus sp. MBR-141]
MSSGLEKQLSFVGTQDLLFGCVKSAFLAWVSVYYPDRDFPDRASFDLFVAARGRSETIQGFSRTFPDLFDPNVASRAIENAAEIDTLARVKSTDALSIYDAVRAAPAWKAVTEDARRLSQLDGHKRVVCSPLWPRSNAEGAGIWMGPPEWALARLAAFEESDLVQNGSWGIWLNWYRGVLRGDQNQGKASAFGEEADLEIAGQPAVFWNRDPDDAVAQIAAIVANLNPVDAHEIGAQEGGFVFTARDGELSHVPSLPDFDEVADRTQEKLFVRLKSRLERFRQSMQNSLGRYPVLGDVLEDYARALAVNELAELEIDELWLSGVGLISQARAFAALDETRQVTEPLEPEQQALLGEIARLHGAFVMGFEAGRRLAERSQIPLLTLTCP